jgi:hypothetical protein
VFEKRVLKKVFGHKEGGGEAEGKEWAQNDIRRSFTIYTCTSRSIRVLHARH